jgi:hypothetical protein
MITEAAPELIVGLLVLATVLGPSRAAVVSEVGGIGG